MRSLLSSLQRLSFRWFQASVQIRLLAAIAIVFALVLASGQHQSSGLSIDSARASSARANSAQIDATQIETRLDATAGQPHEQAAQRPIPKLEHPKTEIRGVWITNVASSVMFAPWGISRAIGR